MERAEIRRLVEQTFPFVPKPSQGELSFHGDDCAHCAMSREYLDDFNAPELPASAIRYLFDELTTLSSKGVEWVLPSYLRHILDQPDLLDSSTEYLIYNLGPEPEFEQETLQRLSRLTPAQFQCLTTLLQYWQQSERWAEYCAEDLARAIRFLQAHGRDA